MLNSSGECKYLYLLQHLSFEFPCCLLLVALVSVNLGDGWDYTYFSYVDPRNALKSVFAGASYFVVKDLSGYFVYYHWKKHRVTL